MPPVSTENKFKCDVQAGKCLIVVCGVCVGHLVNICSVTLIVRQKHTLIFVRVLVGNFSALFLSTAPLFGSASLFSRLCYTGRTSAASFRSFPFLPLSILLFVLLGFLFKLLVGTAGQGRAGDDCGGNCE